jgi:hypothetical protein
MALALVALAMLGLMLGSVLMLAAREARAVRTEARRLQAEWLLEAGARRAAARLSVDAGHAGEAWTLPASVLAARVTTTRVDDDPGAPASTVPFRIHVEYPIDRPDPVRLTRTYFLPEGPR